MGFYDLISTHINVGLYLIVGVAAVIYCCVQLPKVLARRTGRRMPVREKVTFVLAAAVSVIFGLDFLLAGDVYPKFAPEEMARLFAETLSKGRIEDIIGGGNKVRSRLLAY